MCSEVPVFPALPAPSTVTNQMGSEKLSVFVGSMIFWVCLWYCTTWQGRYSSKP